MKRVCSWRAWVPAILAVVLVGGSAAALPPPSSEELAGTAGAFELVSGVIVDPALPAVYLMRPGGGVEALAADSGELLWTSDRGARPLALFGDLLVVQADVAERAGVLRVDLLDRRRGAPRARFDLALPEGVWGVVDQGSGRELAARAEIRGDDLAVVWESVETRFRGVAPPPGRPLRSRRAGAYRLDLVGEQALAIDPMAIPPEPVPELPPAVRAEVEAGVFQRPPIVAGDLVAATVREFDNGEPWVVLRRWELSSGDELAAVELYRGAAVLERPSADRRHLLVSQRVAPGARDEYRFTIFAVATGERLGEVRDHSSHVHFFVRGTTLIYEARPYGRRQGTGWIEQGRRLRAVELGDGGMMWERPLRDLSYRGPVPP